MENLNDKIVQLKEEKYLKEKYARRLKQLEEDRKNEAGKEKELKEKLEKEMKDVDRLKGVSLTGFFLMLSGKKEDRLEKEKEEAYKAEMLHEECKQKLAELDEDIANLHEKLRQIGDVDSKLSSVYRQKEELIHMTDPALSQILNNLDEQKVIWEMELNELEEAIDAAVKANGVLKEAESSLSSARNWGYMDMAGGGLLSTFAKRSHMDEAKEALHSAQYYLKRLQSELDDLGKEMTSNLEVGDFLHIADYFFDNIFSDWMVQEKISTSADQVDQCLERVGKLLPELKEEKIRVQSELEKVKEQRLSYLRKNNK